MRERVLLIPTNLPLKLWDETVSHANWLLNCTLSARISFEIPLQKRLQIMTFNSEMLRSSALGYAIIYYPQNIKANKLFLDQKLRVLLE